MAPDGPTLLVESGATQQEASALLRDAARAFHAPKRGRVALVLDLAAADPAAGAADEAWPATARLWRLLAAALAQSGVARVDEALRSPALAERVIRGLQAWLTGD